MEILSPAGNYQSAMAAFCGGADAVYLGGKSFSARMGADNFSNEDLTSVVDFAHSIGKKVYVTLNTLLFQDEFMEAVEFAIFCHEIAVDGIIVQDLGLASYLHQVVPNLPLHASTQLNCHNLDQAYALKKAGFVRVVLARECPKEFIKEVKKIGLEVEVFVHGALCVCYSGNCLLSSFIGGRSGNRGRCAQPCRMNYDVYEDGQKIAEDCYAISTKDLETLDSIEELRKLGADSLKIEGRLKSEAYVYQTALAYRHMVDHLSSKGDKEKLQSLFSRGFTKGFINGESPFELLNQKTSSHQGERIGKVVRVHNKRVSILLEKEVHRLDGVRFNGPEQLGLALEKFFVRGEAKEIGMPRETIEIANVDFSERIMGQEVIRTTDHSLETNIKEILNKGIRVPVSATLDIGIGDPLVLTVSFNGQTVKAIGGLAEKPQKGGTPWERIRSQMAKSGEYPYSIQKLFIQGEDAFVPISSLNALRNEAFDKLRKALTKHNSFVRGNYECVNAQASSDFHFEVASTNIDEMTPYDTPYIQNRVVYGRLEHKDHEMISFACEVPETIEAMASPYCNITNSYALDFFFGMGFTTCFVSLEADYDSIKSMVEDYEKRHNVYPNIGVFAYGRPEMMILKSCPIGTIYKNKALHCNRCHKHRYELKDRFGIYYPMKGDSACTTTIYADKPVFLLDKIDELEDAHVSSALVSFTVESSEEKESVYCSMADQNGFDPEKHNRGHYRKRSL